MTVIDIHKLRLADLPRASCETVGIKLDDTEGSRATRKAVDSYLENFVADADGKSKCPSCGWDLGGLLGSFSWGAAHGEGACSCGYPARAHHEFPDPDGGEPLGTLSGYILAYHPSVLEPSHDRN